VRRAQERSEQECDAYVPVDHHRALYRGITAMLGVRQERNPCDSDGDGPHMRKHPWRGRRDCSDQFGAAAEHSQQGEPYMPPLLWVFQDECVLHTRVFQAVVRDDEISEKKKPRGRYQ
jgi:hypothetical protein